MSLFRCLPSDLFYELFEYVTDIPTIEKCAQVDKILRHYVRRVENLDEAGNYIDDVIASRNRSVFLHTTRIDMLVTILARYPKLERLDLTIEINRDRFRKVFSLLRRFFESRRVSTKTHMSFKLKYDRRRHFYFEIRGIHMRLDGYVDSDFVWQFTKLIRVLQSKSLAQELWILEGISIESFIPNTLNFQKVHVTADPSYWYALELVPNSISRLLRSGCKTLGSTQLTLNLRCWKKACLRETTSYLYLARGLIPLEEPLQWRVVRFPLSVGISELERLHRILPHAETLYLLVGSDVEKRALAKEASRLSINIEFRSMPGVTIRDTEELRFVEDVMA